VLIVGLLRDVPPTGSAAPAEGAAGQGDGLSAAASRSARARR